MATYSSGHDLAVCGLWLATRSLDSASNSVCMSSLCPSPACTLTLNKLTFKKRDQEMQRESTGVGLEEGGEEEKEKAGIFIKCLGH